MIDWSQYEKPVLKIAKVILADFFDIRMRRLYGENYSEIILKYAEENKENSDSRVSSICGPICEKRGINAQDLVDQFDISALNHLILFAELAEDESKQPIYYGAFSSRKERNDFSSHIGKITRQRNVAKHNDNVLDSFECIKHINDMVFCLSEFLLFLERSTWNDSPKRTYITRMENDLRSLKQELLCAVGRNGLLRLSVVGMDQNIINGMKLELWAGNSLLASWVQYDKPLSIQLCDGEYRLCSSEPQNNYELKPETFRVTGININEEQTFKAQLTICDEELFQNIFQRFLCGAAGEDFWPALEYLNNRNHLSAILLLAFLKRYGITTSKDEITANECLSYVDFYKSPDELERDAREAYRKKDLSQAAILYIGYSLISNNGKGFFYAGIIFRNLVHYDLCSKCLKEAANMGYKQAEEAYEQLGSKEDFEKRMNRKK